MNIKCEVCGSSDIVKHSGMFICQSCGMKYSLDEIKTMLASAKQSKPQENTEEKINTQDELQNLYTLARRAKDEDNEDNAAKYYSMILVKDPESWEAAFYSEYFKATGCRVMDISSAITSLSSCTSSVFKLIRKNVASQNERSKYYEEVTSKVIDLASMMYQTEKVRCDKTVKNIGKETLMDAAGGFSSITSNLYDIRAQNEAKSDFRSVTLRIVISLTEMADSLNEIGEAPQIAVNSWKAAVNMLVDCFKKKALKNELYTSLVKRIMDKDRSYADPLTQETPLDKFKSKFKTYFSAPDTLFNPPEGSDVYTVAETWKASISTAKKEFISQSADFLTQGESEKSLQELLTSLRYGELSKLFRALIPDISDETKITKAVKTFLEVSEIFGTTKDEGKELLSKISKNNIEVVGRKGCFYGICWFFAIASVINYMSESGKSDALIIAAVAAVLIVIMFLRGKSRQADAAILDQKLENFLNPQKANKKSEPVISAPVKKLPQKTSGEVLNTRKTEKENHNIPVSTKSQILVKKGLELLKQSDFVSAGQIFEQVLAQNPKNSAAYVGKLMARMKAKNVNELVALPFRLENDELFRKALEYANSQMKETLRKYIQANNAKNSRSLKKQ